MPRDLRLLGQRAAARRDIYVIELACSLRIGKIFVEFLSEFLSEPKKLVQLRIHFNASLQICEQQSIFLLVSARYKDKRREQTIFINVIFAEVFAKTVCNKIRARVFLKFHFTLLTILPILTIQQLTLLTATYNYSSIWMDTAYNICLLITQYRHNLQYYGY